MAAWRAVSCGMGLGVMAAASSTLAQPPHLSPDAFYEVVLTRDTDFGQVERLQVLMHPGTARARVVFESVGDVPLRFLGWTDGGTAEFEAPDADGARRLVLRCGAQACRLDGAAASPGDR